MLIQNLDITDVSSERRNPILANVMAQLDYMEKRGSGLTRICNETKALDGYKDELKPVFKSTPSQFQTIIYATAAYKMSETLSVSQRTIERDLSALQKKGVLKHEGKDNDGVWILNYKRRDVSPEDYKNFVRRIGLEQFS